MREANAAVLRAANGMEEVSYAGVPFASGYNDFLWVFRDPVQLEESKREGYQKKMESFIRSLVSAGFHVERGHSLDGDEIFVTFGFSQQALMHWADKLNFPMELKSGGMAPFEFDKVEDYQLQGLEDHFESCTMEFPQAGPERDEYLDLLFSPAQRQFLTLRKLTEPKPKGLGLRLNRLKSKGWYKSLIALHDQEERQELIQTWGQFKKLWIPQPLERIRLYFGEKVAMYFAWIGMLTTWLWIPSILGIIVGIYSVASDRVQVTAGTSVSEKIRWDNALSPALALFMIFWATIFNEMWKRRANSLAFHWGMTNYEEEEEIREEFKSEPREVDFKKYIFQIPIRVQKSKSSSTNWTEKYFPSWKRHLIYCITIPTLGGIIAAVIVTAYFIKDWKNNIFRENNGVTPTSLLVATALANTVAMIFFQVLYKKVAAILNRLENYRTNTEFENSEIIKTFIFQYINSNIALFFISFGPFPSLNDTAEEDLLATGQQRLQELFIQMIVNLGVKQIIQNVIEVGKPWLMTKLKRRRDRKNREKLKLAHVEPSSLDEENNLQPYESPFDDYSEIAVQFAYVVQFTFAFPWAPVMALLNNIFEIRIDANKLLKQAQRPPALGAENIGSWQLVMEVLVMISIVVNALLMSLTSSALSQFYGIDLVAPSARLSTFIVIEHFLMFFMFAVKYMIPDVPGLVKKALSWEEFKREQIKLKNMGLLEEDDEPWSSDDEEEKSTCCQRCCWPEDSEFQQDARAASLSHSGAGSRSQPNPLGYPGNFTSPSVPVKENQV